MESISYRESTDNRKRSKGNEKIPLDEKITKERSKQKKEISLYKYSNQIPLAEAILLNDLSVFLQIQDGRPIISEKIELENITIVPPKKTAYLSKEYFFSSIGEIENYIRRAEKQTIDSLFYRVKSIWKKYFDIDDEVITLCSADTIFTYVQDRLGMTHYVLFVGDNNTGKSNALTIFEYLGYRPLKDISINPANIYNFLGQMEEGQGVILEDEIDNIDSQEDKMRIYKAGYVKGAKVTRMYESSSSSKSNAREQKRYNTFCFKAFSSEKQPLFYKAKGFMERLFIIRCSSGKPLYDIIEVVSDTSDPKYKKLASELEDVRKLLLVYRTINYDKPIPDVNISLKNRDRQLCKPLIRLFQDSKVIKEILESLSKAISEKRDKKLSSLDSYLFSVIVDLVRGNNEGKIPNEDIWMFITQLPGNPIANKPQSYYTDEFGTLSKTTVTRICEDKFGAKKGHDGKNRFLVFDKGVLYRLADNYVPLEPIEITPQIKHTAHDTSNTFNTFWKYAERNVHNSNIILNKQPSKLPKRFNNIREVGQKSIPITYDVQKDYSKETSIRPNKVLETLQMLNQKKDVEEKIKERGLFRKWPGSDIWGCPFCNNSGDKWYM